MKGNPILPARSQRKPFLRAFTLVEVMVSTMILAMGMTGLTGLYMQNMRYSKWQTHNVHISNSSFSILDQIKNMGANPIWAAYIDPTNNQTLDVITVDPTDPTDGYRTFNLKINQKDNAVVNSAWNNVTLNLGRRAADGSIPVSYWITVRRNKNTPNDGTPVRDILEMTVIYKWKDGSKRVGTLNQLQLSFPAPNCTFN